MTAEKNVLNDCPAIDTELFNVEVRKCYDYLKDKGAIAALQRRCDTSRATLLKTMLHGYTNIKFVETAFLLEQELRQEERTFKTLIMENRMKFQQSRADNETYIENSASFHEDAQILEAL